MSNHILIFCSIDTSIIIVVKCLLYTFYNTSTISAVFHAYEVALKLDYLLPRE